MRCFLIAFPYIMMFVASVASQQIWDIVRIFQRDNLKFTHCLVANKMGPHETYDPPADPKRIAFELQNTWSNCTSKYQRFR